MTYVDEIQRCAPHDPAGGRWRWNNFCHLLADTEPELFDMAERIKIKPQYVQELNGRKYFSLTVTMRNRALKNGAQRIATVEAIKLLIPPA